MSTSTSKPCWKLRCQSGSFASTREGERLEPLLECRNITKRYGAVLALDDLSLAIRPGTVTAVLGLNGAGKSTLFRILAGLVADFEGEVLWLGKPARRSVGPLPDTAFLFDDPMLFEDMDAAANARLFAALGGVKASASALEKAAAFLGTAARRKVRGHSHGMRCRLAYALATLRPRAALLVLDEPTNGLDVEALEALEAELRGRADNDGTAVLFSTHYLETVERIADRAVILHKGRLQGAEEGPRPQAARLRDRLLSRDGER